MGKECVFCGHIFQGKELLDLDFLLQHTAHCVASVCEREKRKCVCLCSSCTLSSSFISHHRQSGSFSKTVNKFDSLSELFKMTGGIIESFISGKDLLSLALVNKTACTPSFHKYQPTQMAASHPSQFLPGITKLRLDMYPKTINLPPTLTYLHINGIEAESFNWPPSLHTLVLGKTIKSLRPEGLKVLKIEKECHNLSYFLPSSLIEIHGYDGLPFSCSHFPILLLTQKLNLHYNICCNNHQQGHVFPPSLTYIKSLTISERENIPRTIMVDKIEKESEINDLDMLLRILQGTDPNPSPPPPLAGDYEDDYTCYYADPDIYR